MENDFLDVLKEMVDEEYQDKLEEMLEDETNESEE